MHGEGHRFEPGRLHQIHDRPGALEACRGNSQQDKAVEGSCRKLRGIRREPAPEEPVYLENCIANARIASLREARLIQVKTISSTLSVLHGCTLQVVKGARWMPWR